MGEKIWIRISQIQDGGHHFEKVFLKVSFFLDDGFPKSSILFVLFYLQISLNTICLLNMWYFQQLVDMAITHWVFDSDQTGKPAWEVVERFVEAMLHSW